MNRRTVLKGGAVLAITAHSKVASGTAHEVKNDCAALEALFADHATAMAADNEAWSESSDIEDSEAMCGRPKLEIQIGRMYVGRDDDGNEVTRPIIVDSIQKMETDAKNFRDQRIRLHTRPGKDHEIREKIEASCRNWINSKTEEFRAIEAERKRIEDECGYTAAVARRDQTMDRVKEIERQIVDFEPQDLQTAGMKARWIVHAYEEQAVYIEDEDLLDALKAIGRASA